MVNLESLPNETFLDIFEYFDGIDLLRAFYGLNSRFNALLYKQFRLYSFKFYNISKRDFDMICKQHLPNIAEQIICLRLYDYDETPEQINLFYSYISSLSQFTHLQSLQLSYLHSYEILLNLLNQCLYLSNFIQLTLKSCNLSTSQIRFQSIIDKIWNLPKLSRCYLDIKINDARVYCIPTRISISLKYLTVFGYYMKLNEIDNLLNSTPCLKTLSISIDRVIDDDYALSVYPSLIKCNLRFYDVFNISQMILLFQNMPNLQYLNIDIYSRIIDGHQWEHIIHNFLPNLKQFHPKMEMSYDENEDIKQISKNLFDSFRTPFWTHEHQWFIQCVTWGTTVYVSTIADKIVFLDELIVDSWQSTSSQYNKQDFYNTITAIFDETVFDQQIPSDICLPNIDYLYIKLPINDQFWTVVSDLHHLHSLTVSSHTDSSQSQLQILLNRAPVLHSLTIEQDSSLPLQTSLFTYTNASVRKLNLQDSNYCFNEEECLLLSRSPLGRQCEVLSISIKDREGIIHLIKNMIQLRSLNVKYEDKHDVKLISWLKYRLPSIYTYPKTENIVIIWR